MRKIQHFSKRFWAGLVLGAGPVQKIKAAFGFIFISKVSSLTFILKKFGRTQKVTVRTGSDVATLIEVFFDEEYKVPQEFFPKTIIDLGANVGFASLYFSLRDPTTSIVAIEPDPQNISLLTLNTQENKNIKIIAGAIAETIGIQTLYSIPKQGMSSSLIERPKAEPLKVTTYSLDSLLDSMKWQRVDLVKFDIEGAEWHVFKKQNTRVKTLVGEFHEDLTGKTVQEFSNLFGSYTATIKKIQNKRYIVFFGILYV